MAENCVTIPPGDLDLVQLRLLADQMTERNNARAEIVRASAGIRVAYAQLVAGFEGRQLPDVFTAITEAMNDSLAVLAYRWSLCDTEEQGDLECFRLLVWRG
ncbi:hypothetical protein N7519_009161 [Penicillium mononematosum]|uniref:uncharacterized protein n=1 Tax=Penicillium mononematosum TaxID=268346 RepID=UPI002549A592|nr:uncharacterized protein N7519_009161 [Penicillium mononematosum]KAJ6178700.1 hypothetical protein N7519_009161 [Penicillium mononematosum]